MIYKAEISKESGRKKNREINQCKRMRETKIIERETKEMRREIR